MIPASCDELTLRILEILRDELLPAGEALSADSDLIEAGLDSLAVTQLLLAIEESTGVLLDESLLTPENLASARALAAVVHARGQR